jgi:ubiquitin carboxyl-terminal hydrolase 5/13
MTNGFVPSDGDPRPLDETTKVPQVSQEAVASITAMGFSENRATRALLATNNSGAENATNWLFEHMDDPSKILDGFVCLGCF